jgi:hypothetical protein
LNRHPGHIAVSGPRAPARPGAGPFRHPGNLYPFAAFVLAGGTLEGFMDGIIYLIGLIVVIMAILSFLGLR